MVSIPVGSKNWEYQYLSNSLVPGPSDWVGAPRESDEYRSKVMRAYVAGEPIQKRLRHHKKWLKPYEWEDCKPFDIETFTPFMWGMYEYRTKENP